MPGPAAHLSILELQIAKALAKPGEYGAVGSALSSFPEQASLGCIGPDMLFWADWAGYTPIVNAIFDVYHELDEIYEKLAAIWQPIGEAIDKVTDVLTGGLANALNDTVAYVSGIVNTAMLDLITNKINYFQTLKPGLQRFAPAYPEEKWNWLDFTHHRGTGRFAKHLISNAKSSGDVSQMAYAYGWLSHVTADVVGHAYVNLAVGGPWRTHFQRHHLQENFMDVWTWGYYHTSGVAMPGIAPSPGSPLPFDYAAFNSVSEANLHKKIDMGDDLPDALQSLLAKTLSEVYGPLPHPKVLPTFLGKSEVNRAYQMQKEAFEIMTGKARHLGPPKPPKVFGDNEPATYPSSSGSGGGSGGGGGGGFSLSSLLSSIWNFIKDTLTYLAGLGLWLVSMVTHALTYPVRYALYLMQLGLYQIYRAFRWALVVSAFVYPDVDQLADPFAQQFINPSPLQMINEPHFEFPLEKDHSMFFPTTAVEPQTAIAGPYAHFNLNYPYWFIEGEPYDKVFESQLVEAKTPEATIEIASVLMRNLRGGPYQGSLGSAVDFYLRKAGEIHRDGGDSFALVLPDWNIDADRGYGFKCWQANSALESTPPGSAPPTVPVSVSYHFPGSET